MEHEVVQRILESAGQDLLLKADRNECVLREIGRFVAGHPSLPVRLTADGGGLLRLGS
jgi:hypothetical protein